MTTRHDLVRDLEDIETILVALGGLREDIPDKTVVRAIVRCLREDIPDKTVIRAIVRCLWHILEYLIRRGT